MSSGDGGVESAGREEDAQRRPTFIGNCIIPVDSIGCVYIGSSHSIQSMVIEEELSSTF